LVQLYLEDLLLFGGSGESVDLSGTGYD